MALSTCPKAGCNSHSFEMVQYSPANSNFKMLFTQCTKCGTVVGVTEYYNIGKLLHNLAKKLNVDIS
jgi:hypothetical protein